MKLSIIIPVRNEVQTIATLVKRVQAVDYGMSREIIVVDGDSTDGTREALLGLPASPEVVLVLEDEARGKGRAVRTGFERATGDVLVVQDADLELDPGQIPALLEHLISGERPAVFGSRFKDQGRGGTPLLSYAGNKFLTWSANVLFFTRMTDILTCYKVLRSDVAETLNLECDGFDFDAEVPCRLLRQGHRILEVPVTYNPRSIEEGKKLTTRVGWSVLRAILHVRFSRSSARSDLTSSVGSQ
jgi:glycosyltransferase involved in cell wall biosynthesis